MTRILAALFLAVPALAALPASAQDVVASYAAYIGDRDLFNSNGERLTAPAQVLRQDRANYHRFGIAQAGDEWDPLFGSADNRAAMESMVNAGSIEPGAAQILMSGGAMVLVQIFGSGGVGTSVQVSVAR
ncbi:MULTISPECIES: hypothetical protein [Ponticoccus]|uniref:Uncharacterized protein n=1 Tax=Ponticoccus litoralis TaxID=422297 RepID=A0AAW9SCR9_9RHOB